MPKILVNHCLKCGETCAQPESAIVSVHSGCGGAMAGGMPLADTDQIAKGEFVIRCVALIVPRLRNPDWEKQTEEEVWVVGNGVYDGGEHCGTFGRLKAIRAPHIIGDEPKLRARVRAGLAVYQGIPAVGLPSGNILGDTRHGVAAALVQKLVG